MNNTTKTAPERSWLQVNPDASVNRDGSIEGDDLPFPDNDEGVTWCRDSVGGLEVEYVRADIARKQVNAALSVARMFVEDAQVETK